MSFLKDLTEKAKDAVEDVKDKVSTDDLKTLVNESVSSYKSGGHKAAASTLFKGIKDIASKKD